MKTSGTLIRKILGPVGMDLRPLAYAVDRATELIFIQGIPRDGIRLTKDIYPAVSERLNRERCRSISDKSTGRAVHHIANRCWDEIMDRDLVLHYIGAPLQDIHSPGDRIFYLAVYAYLEMPYYIAMKERPNLMF